LGYFADSKATTILSVLTSDPERTVRIKAIRSLGKIKSDKGRFKVLQDILSEADRPRVDHIEACGSIFIGYNEPKARTVCLDKLLPWLEGKNIGKATPEERQTTQKRSFKILTGSMGHNKRVLKAFRERLIDPNWTIANAAIVRQLARHGDPWIKKNMARMVKGEASSMQIRQGVIGALHLACPKDRWKILGWVISQGPSSGLIKHAIKELTRLPGRRAIKHLESLLKVKGLSSSQMGLVKKSLSEVKAGKASNPCASK